MARIQIDEGILSDQRVAPLSIGCQLFYDRLMLLADHNTGVLPFRAAFLTSHALAEAVHEDGSPVTRADGQRWLERLRESKLLVPFDVRGEPFAFFPSWHRYQAFRHPRKDRYPLPPAWVAAQYPDYYSAMRSKGSYRDESAHQPTLFDGAPPGGPSNPALDQAPDKPPAVPPDKPPAAGAGAKSYLQGLGLSAGAVGGGAPPDRAPTPLFRKGLPDPEVRDDPTLTTEVSALASAIREHLAPRHSLVGDPDAAEIAIWERLLARAPPAERDAWLHELVDLMRWIAKDEKHGGGPGPATGRKFVVVTPADLEAHLPEMLAKRGKRASTLKSPKALRLEWITERCRQLTDQLIQQGTPLSPQKTREIAEQADVEWRERNKQASG